MSVGDQDIVLREEIEKGRIVEVSFPPWIFLLSLPVENTSVELFWQKDGI